MSRPKAKRGRKTAGKTATSPRNGAEIPLGAHPKNTGGKKGRSGRKPFEITQAAKATFEKHRLLEIAAGIAVGRIEEEWFDNEGETHSEPTKNSDRIAAMKFIASYAFGQPAQQVDVTSGGRPLLIVGAA